MDVKLNPFSKVLVRPEKAPGETLSLNRELFVSKAEKIPKQVKKRKYIENTEGEYCNRSRKGNAEKNTAGNRENTAEFSVKN